MLSRAAISTSVSSWSPPSPGAVRAPASTKTESRFLTPALVDGEAVGRAGGVAAGGGGGGSSTPPKTESRFLTLRPGGGGRRCMGGSSVAGGSIELEAQRHLDGSKGQEARPQNRLEQPRQQRPEDVRQHERDHAYQRDAGAAGAGQE